MLAVTSLANDPRNVTFALHTLKDPFDDVLLRGGWNVEGRELEPFEPHEGVHNQAGGYVVKLQELLCCIFGLHLLTNGLCFSASLFRLKLLRADCVLALLSDHAHITEQ